MFERWSSQGVVFELWCSLTTWWVYIKRSPLKLKATFWQECTVKKQGLVSWFGEFRRGRWSLDDEHWCGTPATTVTVTNIEAVEKLTTVKPRVTTWEIPESLSKERQRPCPYFMTIFVSENDVPGGSPTHRQTSNDWLALSGVNSSCESSMEAVQNGPGKCGQVTKLGAINMIQKPRCSQWFDCFWTSPLPQNLKDYAAHRRKWKPVSSENQAMLPPFLLRTADSHCGLVRASLSPKGLRSLVPVLPKDPCKIFFWRRSN